MKVKKQVKKEVPAKKPGSVKEKLLKIRMSPGDSGIVSVKVIEEFNLCGHDFFVHEQVCRPKWYSVTEKQTGMAVFRGDKKHSIDDVKRLAQSLIESPEISKKLGRVVYTNKKKYGVINV